MTEFYGDRDPGQVTAPEQDPVLTVRMQPPDTQARRLDLDTPRAVKVDASPEPWVVTDPHRVDSDYMSMWFTDAEVADWPIVSMISVGAAQRLAAGRVTGATGPAPALPSDEDEKPFR